MTRSVAIMKEVIAMDVTGCNGRRPTMAAFGAIVVATLTLAGGVASAVAAAASSDLAVRNGASVLDGVYRLKWSEKELLAAGASRGYVGGNFSYLHGNQGVLTMTLRAGRFRVQARGAHWSPCPGTYALSGNKVTIDLGAPSFSCHGRITARWSLQKGQLRLRSSQAADPGDEVLFGAKPWTKIS